MRATYILSLLPALAAAADIKVTLSQDVLANQEAIKGRIRVYFSLPDDDASQPDPMYANGDEWDTNQVFGFDAEFDKDTLSYTLEENHFGYPIASLLDLPPSAYTVQAELAGKKNSGPRNPTNSQKF